MDSFEIGEIAIVINPELPYYLEECTIQSILFITKELYRGSILYDINCKGHLVKIEGFNEGFLRLCDLRKKPKADDHRDITVWSDCIWKPQLIENTLCQ